MPLSCGPTTRRWPRTSVTVRRSESARAMKNSGPAFIGATMRRSIFCANGASPFLARPIQFDAMKPKSMSFLSSRLAFSTLAWADVLTSAGANACTRSSTVLSAKPWLKNVESRSAVPMRTPARAISLALDALVADHLAPAGVLLAQIFFELRGRARRRRDPGIVQPRAQLRLVQCGDQRGIEFGDDRRRRSGRRQHAGPVVADDAGKTFLDEGRYVGKNIGAFGRGGGQRLQLAGAHLPHDRRHVAEQAVEMAGQHVGDRRRRAAIRHFLQLNAGRILEQLPAEIRNRAAAGDAAGDAAGLPARQLGKLARRTDLHVGVDDEDGGIDRGLADRGEIL